MIFQILINPQKYLDFRDHFVGRKLQILRLETVFDKQLQCSFGDTVYFLLYCASAPGPKILIMSEYVFHRAKIKYIKLFFKS